MSNINQRSMYNSLPIRPSTSGSTITSCPGLTRSCGKWWIPIGETAQKCTYCDYCKNKYKIRGVTLYKKGMHSAKCNCDSYLLKSANNLHHSLFNVSLWSRSLKTNYSLAKGHKSIFNVPTGKNFAILVDSDLPTTQVFKLKVTFYNDSGYQHSFDIQDSNGSKNVYIKSSVLIRNHGGMDTSELKFIENQQSLIDNTAWDILETNNINRVKLEISVSNIALINVSKLTNTYLGSYKATKMLDLTHSINNNLPRLSYLPYDNIDKYSRPIVNESDLYHYDNITNKPITIEFTLKDTVSKQPKIYRVMTKNLKDIIPMEVKSLKNAIKKETWIAQITGKTTDDNEKLIELASKLSTLLEIKNKIERPLITEQEPSTEQVATSS